MKDSLEKQDKTKTVDIFQVLADSIQKEFVQSIFIKIIPKFQENSKTIPTFISPSVKPACFTVDPLILIMAFVIATLWFVLFAFGNIYGTL